MGLFNSAKSYLVSTAKRAATLGRYHDDDLDEEVVSSEEADSESNENQQDASDQFPSIHEWSEGYPSTTFIDKASGLLTTSTADAGKVPESMTLYDIYRDRATRLGDEPMYHFKSNGEWVVRTANEMLQDIRSAAKGLLHAGLKKGDAVAFMCHTSYQWNVVDAAVVSIGGIIATVYDTDSAEQIRYIVNNSDATSLIVETRDMREKADGAIEDCPSLKRISCMENGALEELQAYGKTVSDEELDARIASI